MTTTSYEKKLQYNRQREEIKTRQGQEIGAIPPIVNPERRTEGEDSFARFCKLYFPNIYRLPWSEFHLKAAEKLQRAIEYGGLFAFAMPRGTGKTSLCESAMIWGILTGRVKYGVLVGATGKASTKRLKSIKVELSFNDLLLQDFPEACYPLKCLDWSARKAEGQRYQGEKTMVEWATERLVMPTIPGSPSSGSVIDVLGITGEIRGLNHKLKDGTLTRPDLAICDDPQTRESAASPTQSETRAEIISGDVAYLAGPDKPIAVVIPCTVIHQGDLADRMLNRKLHPEWQGERTRMVEKFPERVDLWEKYEEILRVEWDNERDGTAATEFYRQNREEMDRGAMVTWEHRKRSDQLSALEHAMVLMFRDKGAFFAEYQNDPLERGQGDIRELTANEICAKANGVARGLVPAGHSLLTSFVDVQGKALFWAVISWKPDFTGHIVDYGAWPDQGMRYFTLSKIKKTIGRAIQKGGFEAKLYAALELLHAELMGREYMREDGTALRINLGLVDGNWGKSTAIVREFSRHSPYASLVAPCHGRYVGAASRPLTEGGRQADRIGHYWRTSAIEAQQHLLYDVNYWKSFSHERLAVPFGDSGCLSIFGEASDHQMLADNLLAEYRVRVEARGQVKDEWKLSPAKPDNHFLDCVVGCCAGASYLGARLATVATVPVIAPKKKKRRRRINVS